MTLGHGGEIPVGVMMVTRRLPVLAVPLFILATLHIAVPVASAAPGPPALPAPPGGEGLEFGQVIDDAGQIRFTDDVAQRVADAGAGWVRVNFRLGGFHDWNETSTFGYSALSQYDEIVATAQRHGLQVLGLLSNEAWHGYVSDLRTNSAEAAGGDGDNPYLKEFSQQAVGLIQYFSGRVERWEIWNEPNATPTYLFPSNFAWLLAQVYAGVRSTVTAPVELISGGLSSVQESDGSLSPASTGAAYLQETYDRGRELAGWETIREMYGSYPLDAIGQHLYVDGYRSTSRETIRHTLDMLRDTYVAAEGGESKQTVVTEVGWASGNVSERVQADNLQTAFAELMATPWVQTASWFFLRDSPAAGLSFGLLRADGSAKPTWQAYQIVTIPEVPPLPPAGLLVASFPAGVRLEWQENAAPDLAGYRVYRGDSLTGPFTPLTSAPISDLGFVDADAPTGTPVFYRITAVDQGGNESAASWTVGATRADLAGLDAFQRTWARTDQPVAAEQTVRTWMWGWRPFTPVLTERYDDSPNVSRQVQYFDKSRMELTDPGADPNADWYVTNGLLVVELMTGRLQVGDNAFIQREPAAVNVAGDPGSGPTYATLSSLRWSSARAEGTVISTRLNVDGSLANDPALAAYGVKAAHTVADTKHTVAQPFWDLMTATGLIFQNGQYTNAALFVNPFYATGFPITEAYWTQVLVAGKPADVLVQCFERRCLTYTPDNPDGWKVEAGNVGQHYYRWRYGDLPAGT